jgi:hypothetical protein
MRKSITAAAGAQVQAEYSAMKGNSVQAFATSNGTLPCKQILFVPWRSDSSNPHNLKPSLSAFIHMAVGHAVNTGYKTVG